VADKAGGCDGRVTARVAADSQTRPAVQGRADRSGVCDGLAGAGGVDLQPE